MIIAITVGVILITINSIMTMLMTASITNDVERIKGLMCRILSRQNGIEIDDDEKGC